MGFLFLDFGFLLHSLRGISARLIRLVSEVRATSFGKSVELLIRGGLIEEDFSTPLLY